MNLYSITTSKTHTLTCLMNTQKQLKTNYELSEESHRYIVKYDNINYILLKPNEDVNYCKFDVETTDSTLWIVKMNRKNKVKKLSAKKFIKKFIKELYSRENNKKESVMTDKEFMIDVNIRMIEERKRIENFSKAQPDSLIDNIKDITSEKIEEIVLNEYIQAWEYVETNRLGQITTVDDNLFVWNVKINNFTNISIKQQLQQVKKKYGYDYLEFTIEVSKKLHPIEPPHIKIIRPRLKESLMSRISNSKQFDVNYWIPSTTSSDIIKRIINIVNNYGIIDIKCEYNDITKHKIGAYLPLESMLLNLASLISTSETDVIDRDVSITHKEINEKLNKSVASANIKKKSSHGHHSYTNTGTGYGVNSDKQWDHKKYFQMLEEIEKKKVQIFNHLINSMHDYDDKIIYNAVDKSILLKHLREELKASSLLEIIRHSETYKRYFMVLQLLCTDTCIPLFKNGGANSLYCILSEKKEECKYLMEMGEKGDIFKTIICVTDMMEDLYNKHKLCDTTIKTLDSSNKKDMNDFDKARASYIRDLTKYKVFVCDGIKDFSSSASAKHYNESSVNPKRNSQIAIELAGMRKSFITDIDNSIFVTVNKKKKFEQRYLIVGPSDTPYAHGCFIFDAYIPPQFPKVAPSVRMRNTGGATMNANLYADGKVCLSILGTYIGPPAQSGEKWIPDKSTVFQVILSIQTLILNEDPYFNEPGYEQNKNRPDYKKTSKQHNTTCSLNTMKHTIRDVLKHPETYPEFEEVIKTHFKYKKTQIIKCCEQWVKDSEEVNGTTGATTLNIKTVFKEIKLLLDQL